MKFQLGTMSLGDILDRGLRLVAGRLGAFYGISLLPMAPIFVLTVIQPMVTGGLAILVNALLIFTGIVFGSLIQAATLRVVEMEYLGRRISVGQALQFGVSKIVPMFLVTLGQSLLFGLGFACCIVPGFLFLTWYTFAGQVVVVENVGSGPAFGRSKALTAGYGGRVLGFILLVGVIYVIFLAVTLGGLPLLLPAGHWLRTGQGLVYQIDNFRNHAINTLLGDLLRIPFGAYVAACITLLYFDLRARKEGFDLELAAASPVEPE